jgi:hypothetical protein
MPTNITHATSAAVRTTCLPPVPIGDIRSLMGSLHTGA